MLRKQVLFLQRVSTLVLFTWTKQKYKKYLNEIECYLEMTTTFTGGQQFARVRNPVVGALALPVPLPATTTTAAGGGSRRPAPQNSRLTWTFAFCAMFAMCSFFIGHVALSSWLTSEESLLERGRLSSFRRQQVLNAADRHGNNGGGSGSIASSGLKRILIFGSHHTGTSIVTKLIMECGAYAGEDLVMLPGNSLKYNENRAAVEADKRVMSKGHNNEKIGPYWVDFQFKWSLVPEDEQKLFIRSVDKVIQDLDQGALAKGKHAWVVKDPRMAILAEQWLSRTVNNNGGGGGICVLVTRNPIEASKRLAKVYNRSGKESLTITEWMEFWAESMNTAARACLKNKRKIVFAHHSELVKNPLGFAQKLEQDIFGEVKRFQDEHAIISVLGTEFNQKMTIDPEDAADSVENERFWTPNIRTLWDALEKGNLAELPPLIPMTKSPHIKKLLLREAYATIVTGNSKGFVAGALALAQSIRDFDSERDLIAMLSVEVDDPTVRNALALAGWKTVEVKKLEEPWYQTHPKCRDFTESQMVRWGRMFSKLRVYSLPYDRILYLDTDTIVLRDPRSYFSLPGDFYAERSPSHRGINAGIMLIRPSEQILEKLITYAREHQPMEFWPTNQVGCTEQ